MRLFVARDVRFCICKFMCSCCSLTTTCALTYLSVIFSEDITQSFTLHIHTCHQLLYFLASTTRTSSAWSASIARARTSLCRAGTCASAPRVRSARSGTSVPCVGRRPVWCCERSLCDSITLYLIPHTSCDSWFPGCVSALAATALGFICFRLHLFSIVRGPSGATALPRRRPTHLRAYFIYHGPPGV